MKSALIITLLVLFSHAGISQSLEGRWKGFYTSEYRPIGYTDQIEKFETPINLEFKLNPDGSYLVHSHTVFGGRAAQDTAVCLMSNKIQGDSIFLQEIQTVNPNTKNYGFQKMRLKLIKGKKVLKMEGKWEDMSTGDSGKVFFNKRD